MINTSCCLLNTSRLTFGYDKICYASDFFPSSFGSKLSPLRGSEK